MVAGTSKKILDNDMVMWLGMKTDRIQTDTADTDTDNFSFSV
jgi:hypothetical protein